MGGTRYQLLNNLTRQIWQWCECRNIFIFASYIESSQNREADIESRRIMSDTEWQLADFAFRAVVNSFGQLKLSVLYLNPY